MKQDLINIDGKFYQKCRVDEEWSNELGAIDNSYFELKIAPDNTITIRSVKDSWSREEVVNLLKSAHSIGWNHHTKYSFSDNSNTEFNKWIEENL